MALVKYTSITFKDLKKLRNKAGLSLKELSLKTGIEYSNLCHYESEYLTMNQATWERVEQALRK